MASDIKVVFEAETAPIDRAVRLLDNLEAELRDVQRAEEQGLISKERLNKETARLNNNISKLKSLSQGSAKNFRKFEKSLYGSGKAARANELAMQQAGYQVQDFIVQVQAGTNPLIAFSQQGSQLAGFFAGPWGAAIGLGIAAVGFLGTALLGLGEKAKTLQEQLDEAADAISDYQGAVDASLSSTGSLTEKFGSLAGFVKEARLEIVAFKKEMMEAKFQSAMASTLGEFAVGGAGEKRSAIYDKFDVTREAYLSLDKERQRTIRSEASRSLNAMTRLAGGEFEGPEEQISLMNQLIASSKTLADIKDGISAEEQEFIEGLIQARDLIFQINAKTSEQLSVEKERGNKLQQIQTDAMAMEAEIAQEALDNTKRNYVFAGRLMQEAASEQAAIDAKNQSRIEANYRISGRLMAQAAQEEQDAQNQLYTNSLLAIQNANAQEIAKAKEQQKLADETHAHMMALQKAYYDDAKTKAAEVASATYLANYNAVLGYQAYGQSRSAAPTSPVEPTKVSGGKSQAQMNREKLQDYLKDLRNQASLEKQLVGKFGEQRNLLSSLITARQDYGDIASKSQMAEIENTIKSIDALSQHQKALEDAAQEQKRMQDFISQSFESGFMSIIDGTQSVKDAFRSMARDIIAELYRVLVVKKLVSAATGFFGFADGGVFQGGSQVQAFANGGVVGGPTFFPMSGGKTGLMGEAGPEAIMPLKRGKNGKLGVEASGESGNVTVVQNFSFSANGDDSVKKIIAQEAPKIAQMTQQQILESRKRGGSFRKAFG